MKKLRAAVKKDLLGLLLTFRFAVGATITVLLAAMATFIATEDYDLRLRDYLAASEQHRADLEGVHVYSYLQPVLVRPPEPLSILDRGFDARLGTEVKIHIYSIPASALGGRQANEFIDAVPAVDLTTLVRVVLGLLAVLLTFDAVLREREAGSLRLVLANGLSRDLFIASKYLSGLLALAIPLGAAFLTALAIIALDAKVELGVSAWLRIAGLAGAYLAYLSVMVLLGLLVSLYAREASSSLALAVVGWLAIVVVLPEGARVLAAGAFGADSAWREGEARVAELRREWERLRLEDWQRDPVRVRLSGDVASFLMTAPDGAVLRRYGSAEYYDSVADYHREDAAAGRRHAERIFAIHEEYQRRLRAEDRLASALAFPSPAFLLASLSQSFAGSSRADYQSFLAACRSYRESLVDYFEARDAFGAWRWFTDDPRETHPWPTLLGLAPEDVDAASAEALFNRLSEPEVDRRTAADRRRFETDPYRLLRLDDLPPFHYQGPSFLEAARRGALAAAGLGALNGIGLWWTFARFQRYDERAG